MDARRGLKRRNFKKKKRVLKLELECVCPPKIECTKIQHEKSYSITMKLNIKCRVSTPTYFYPLFE